MVVLYNLFLVILAPLWWPWMAWRAAKRGERPDPRQRRGDYRDAIPPKGDRPRLWLHAVSVGEFVAAQPLLRELRKSLPEHELVLSVTTSSGHRTAREARERLYDHLVYLPIDLAPFVRRAMRRVQPDALIVMETELWMNLFRAAKGAGTATFVANARMSDRSYPHARRLAGFYRALFSFVDIVLAQSETDASRFRELGAERVEAMGNVKFDEALGDLDDPTDWRAELGLDERPVVVVGSLRAEEFDGFVSNIVSGEEWSWIVAPRHVERARELAEALERYAAEIDHPSIPIGYRSKGTCERVTILDTYGELARIYRIADVVVVGGGFERLGGQNIIQPLACGIPVLHGPHMANFRDVADLADRIGASMVCETSAQVWRRVEDLLSDSSKRTNMGRAARILVEANRGASERMTQAVASELAGRRREQAPEPPK